MSQQIPLSQNKVVLLDDEDFNRLSQHHWCYRGERDGRQGYAIRHQRVDGKYITQYLHREILGSIEPGFEVVFLNHDRLDCRRANLRVVTIQEARRHHRVRRDSLTGLKGISYNEAYNTWSADVYRHGKSYRVGTYHSKEAAVRAYENAVKTWDAREQDKA